VMCSLDFSTRLRVLAAAADHEACERLQAYSMYFSYCIMIVVLTIHELHGDTWNKTKDTPKGAPVLGYRTIMWPCASSVTRWMYTSYH
jgi:hypothetical protein